MGREAAAAQHWEAQELSVPELNAGKTPTSFKALTP